MSAGRRPSACARWHRRSASGSESRRPCGDGSGAGWLVNTAEAMRLVRLSQRAARQAHRLDRGLGRPRHAEPRQGHPLRCPRRQFLSCASRSNRRSRRRSSTTSNALVSEARWNQIAADWRLFVEHGRVYAAHASSGRIVATSAILPYGRALRLDQHGPGGRPLSPARTWRRC